MSNRRHENRHHQIEGSDPPESDGDRADLTLHIARVYTGPDRIDGYVETLCVTCGKRAQIRESAVPANLTMRPVTGMCQPCQQTHI